MIDISNRLKMARKALKLSQGKAASILGVKQQTFQRYETGAIKNPPFSFIESLKEKLGINPSWLSTGEGEMFKLDSAAADPILMSTGRSKSGMPLSYDGNRAFMLVRELEDSLKINLPDIRRGRVFGTAVDYQAQGLEREKIIPVIERMLKAELEDEKKNPL